MFQGRKSPKKFQSNSEFQKSSELLVNGGRLNHPPIPYSPRPHPHSHTPHRGLQQQGTRPFTANPHTPGPTDTILSLHSSPYKPFRSAVYHRSGEKRPFKPHSLPELQMAPLTVPLLPLAGAKSPSVKKRSPSPLRSRAPSPRLNSGHYSHGKHLPGPESIQLLRPNNTLIELHKTDLDRRGFTSWPTYTGSEPPRLLSLQHNMLTRLDPPIQLPSLVLLDLYHNHLKNLAGLHAMPNLRILLLAKNRLTRLDGLDSITKLEVLDLHGNQLHLLTNLSHLKELRLLNLAGNMLRHVSGLRGLDSLTELNLKRNQIRTISDLHLLPRLEKVFLSYNEIYRYEDIVVLHKCSKLRELSLDENPISKHPLYYHTAIVKFYRLKRFDDQELTVESRRTAERILQKSKEKERVKAAQITDEEKRNSAINCAMKHWKTLKAAQYMIIRRKSRSFSQDSESIDIENISSANGEKPQDEKTSVEIKGEDQVDESMKNFTEERKPEKRDVPIIQETLEELSESLNSDSQGPQQIIKEPEEEAGKSCLQVPSHNFDLNKKCELNRSQSSLDISTSHAEAPQRKLRPNSGVEMRHRQASSSSNLLSPNPLSNSVKQGNRDEKFKNGVKTFIRRHSESKLSALKNGNPGTNKNRDEASESRNDCKSGASNPAIKILQKTESSLSLRSLPDRVLTEAVTKIQSNLHRLHNNVDTKQSLDRLMAYKSPVKTNLDKSDVESSDSSEGESDTTDSDSSLNSNANAGLERKRPLSVAHLKIPFPRNRMPSRSEHSSPRGDKNSPGIFREQGPNFLAELEGKVLRLYGNGALRCTELPWEKGALVSATTVHFQYINYDEIVDIFPRLRVRFPHLENFVFVETNLKKCSQLNAMAELHQVNSIAVKREGNPLVEDPNWRLYVIFRLSHWGLTSISGTEISEAERQEASYIFSPLCQLAFTCLPRHQLNALMSARPQNSSNNVSGYNTFENEVAGKDDQDDEETGSWEGPRLNAPHLQELIGKEALQYRPLSKLNKEEISSLTEAGVSTTSLLTWALDSVKRLQRLEESWPSVLHDLTRDSVTDIIKPNYGKICLDALKRELGWKK